VNQHPALALVPRMELSEKQKIGHLLRRFGLGASEAELEYYSKSGLSGAINLLLDYENAPDVTDWDPMIFANSRGTVNIKVMQNIWMAKLVCTQRPLLEKMTLFWHNHFATSSQKVTNSFAMNEHIDVLRENALGNFRSMLLGISKNPAMIFWLDNQENNVGKPNENFAREVMELFTLGVDNGYTEKDVQEAARAFTGWRYGIGRFGRDKEPGKRDQFIFSSKDHDYTKKTIFGQTGNWNGEDVIDMLCQKRQTAIYITQKAWKWFASEEADPKAIDRIAAKFYESKYDIKVLVRGIMEAPEFYSEKCFRRCIKNPIDFAVSTVRQLGVGERIMDQVREGTVNPVQSPGDISVNVRLVRALAPAFTLSTSTISMGMELMAPPDVSGWRTGPYWITSATMVERIKWAERLFVGGTPAPGGNLGGNAGGNRPGPSVGAQAFPLFQDNPTPDGAVKALCSIFDIELTGAKYANLIDAAAKAAGSSRVTQQNASAVARAVTKVIFASPEFQMA
jgi:uncharacterized protein (DUF1800 family)